MKHSVDDYRTELITKILAAVSQEEVKQLVDRVMKEVEQENTDMSTIIQFTKKCIGELEVFSPMNTEARQWSNIKMAKIYFHRFTYQHQLNATVI